MKQNFLLIDQGGRGRAFARKLAESKDTGAVFIAGASTGLEPFAVPVKKVKDTDFEGLATWAGRNDCLTIPLSDDPIAKGIGDFFIDRGLAIWCPSKRAARIESSKKYAKEIMYDAKVATSQYWTFNSFESAKLYIEKSVPDWVIKADGAAFGKGTKICKTHDQAIERLTALMVKKTLNKAGETVVIERRQFGLELSLHAVCSLNHHLMLPPVRDHKRAHDGDKEDDAITGGMGTISPVPGIVDKHLEAYDSRIVQPVLDILRSRGCEFEGLLYPGLILTSEGAKVLEFNARFGDPETQVLMARLKSDLCDLVMAAFRNELQGFNLEWDYDYEVCIVLAARGYPDPDYEKGKVIEGIEDAEKCGVTVLHAGTAINSDGKLVTDGGRVLNVVAKGQTMEGALKGAYEAIKKIHFDGMHYRKEIGQSSLVSTST